MAALALTAIATPHAQLPPADHRDITYILPIWYPFEGASAFQLHEAFTDLHDRIIGEGADARYVKVGFTGYVIVDMSNPDVNIADAAAVDTALASTFLQMDGYVIKSALEGMPVCLNILLPSRARTDAVQRASELDDRRSMQWYADNAVAPEAATGELGEPLAATSTRIVLKGPPPKRFFNGNQIYVTGGGQSEWMLLGTPSATPAPEGFYAFNVTRDIDGSGANAWPADQVVHGTSGWWGHSRYSRKARAIEEAYVRAIGRHLKILIDLYPTTLVAASGDGEIEMAFERSPIVHPALYPTESATVLADYSPFAIAEFRDWLRKGGLYAEPSLANDSYEFSSRYDGDLRPDEDTNADGHTLNGDFGTTFTSWNLRYADWSLPDWTPGSPDPDPKAIPTIGGVVSDAGEDAHAFDAPRTRAPGDAAWWNVWTLFRQTMIAHHNKDFAKWITTNPDNSPVVPTDRWFSYQIPADYLFGSTPANPNFRLVTSASPIWTSYVGPYGGAGITGFNANLGVNGPYGKTLEGAAPIIAANNSRWAVLEWNPSVPVSTDITVYRDEMKLVERYRPVLLVPYVWPTDGQSPAAEVRGTGFEVAMHELVERIKDVPATCGYALSPLPAVPPLGGTFSLTVTAEATTTADCPWTVTSDSPWITFPNGATGTNDGPLTISVATQTGAARSATITIAQRTATVTVTQTACSYALTPSSAPAPKDASTGTFDIVTTPECPWTAASNSAFVTRTSGASGTGSSTVAYAVARNPRRVARTGSLTIGGQTFGVNQAPRPTPFDFTGDGISDLAVFRPGTGNWSVQGQPSQPLGQAGDVPVPGDYDGNGMTERAIFRPATGLWLHQGGTQSQWGLPGDVPVPADYDGNGATDRAVFRTNEGPVARWYVQGQPARSFGVRNDIPVPADYDGDGLADPAVFRPATGTWFVLRSSSGYASTDAYAWGASGDVPVAGDFDGDGKADLTVFRPSSGTWFLKLSATAYATTSLVALGAVGDVPMALDLDADGADDLVAFRPADGTWRAFNRATSGSGNQTFGAPGDIPTAERPRLPPSPSRDVDGDSVADVAVFRPSNGAWFTRLSSTAYGGFTALQWGATGDVPVPGDYDGDRKADLAVYRPANGQWYLRFSSSGFTTFRVEPWGVPGDTAVPADYDGDGRIDLAIYRPSTGEWWIRFSAADYTTYAAVSWGVPGDVPMPADYDGDGRADVAVYRPSTGEWFIRLAAGGSIVQPWGVSTDIPVARDFDGDGRADLAVYRPSNGAWYILDRFSGTFSMTQWGLPTDVPIAADYDGDGAADIAIHRPSTGEWFILRSSNGALLYLQWGLAGDQPVR